MTWWSVLFFAAAHHVPAFSLFLQRKKTHVYSHPVPKYSTFLSPTISAVSILITSGCYKSRIGKPKPASFIWVIFRHHPFLNSRCCSYSCPIPNNRQYSPEIKPTSIKCHIFFPCLSPSTQARISKHQRPALLFRERSDYTDLYENWDTLHLRVNVKNGGLGVKWWGRGVKNEWDA